ASPLTFFPRQRRPPIPTLFPYTTLFRSPVTERVIKLGLATLIQYGEPTFKCIGELVTQAQRQGAVAVTIIIRVTGERSAGAIDRSEEHTSELQSRENLVCRLLLEKKKQY